MYAYTYVYTPYLVVMTFFPPNTGNDATYSHRIKPRLSPPSLPYPALPGAPIPSAKPVVFDSVPRVIECYADRFAVVGGRRYMIGHPCDWAVSICVPTEEGKVEAVPLGSELMEELIPGLQVGFAIGGNILLSGFCCPRLGLALCLPCKQCTDTKKNWKLKFDRGVLKLGLGPVCGSGI